MWLCLPSCSFVYMLQVGHPSVPAISKSLNMKMLAFVFFISSMRLYSTEANCDEETEGVLLTVCVNVLPGDDVVVLLTVED